MQGTVCLVLIRNIVNIQPIPVCHISNEREQIYNLLFMSRGYTLRVMIKLIYY